jgi:RNA polymerase sigma-70 factor (ECF subfamily)
MATMSDSSPRSVQLRQWFQRIRAGDPAAANELFRAIGTRLERLTHKMLDRFPNVRRFEQTSDVLQNALIRLLRALKKVEPTSERHFYHLAAEQVRRELLDLARHYYGERGLGTHQFRHSDQDDSDVPPEPTQPDDWADLERWCAFHEAVAALPVEEREVVGLIFYHGWQQSEVAELLHMSDRSVRRVWQSAVLKLNQALGDWLPEA